jgi:hypothetical protein
LIATGDPIGDLHVSSYYVRQLLDWVPMLIFIGLLLYFLRKMGKGGSFGARQIEYMTFMREYCASHLEETRKTNAALQRIAAALESKGE